jgi:hypothetical protein
LDAQGLWGTYMASNGFDWLMAAGQAAGGFVPRKGTEYEHRTIHR